MCFWSKCLDISDVKRAFVANVLIYQMSDMIIHNMHGYFINRILKTELLFILCSGQKCLQFYLTFTSCLPLPLLTFCQIKNIEKICAPVVKDIFRIWNFYKLSSTPSLNFLSDCATQLFGTEIMPSPRWKWIQIFELFFVKFGLNQGQAGTKSGELWTPVNVVFP